MLQTAEVSSADKLYFARGNAKLDESIYVFSLPAGYSCPGAKECLSKFDINSNTIQDGPDAKYRCFAASQETRPAVRQSRWRNFNMLVKCKTSAEMCKLLLASLPETAETVRIHESGDFFNQEYFDAWMQVARVRDKTIFYAYTKSIPYLVKRLPELPDNLKVVWSSGGRFDSLGEEHALTRADVVFYKDEAEQKNLPIDHDDSHARQADHDFALLLHGIQPKGTEAASAMQQYREERSYNKKKRKARNE